MRRRWSFGGAARRAGIAALIAVAGASDACAQGLLDFTPTERRAIASHGPWPPPTAHDPGNAQAGRREAIALGQRLFFEPRLSPDGRLACASCHRPELAFADGRVRSVGRETLDRHAPSLWNAVHERWYGWDGAADSLWSQAIRPLLDAREMASSGAQLRRAIAADAELACRYRRTFGLAVERDDDEAALVHVAKAIGSFVGSLVSGRTPFDDFRDALVHGDAQAAASYPLDAQRGLRLFVGQGRCNLCHVGPMFSNGEFADTGLPFFVRPGVVDPGRHGGIAALRASRYNLLSGFSDARDPRISTKTRHVDPQHRNFGEFKVPSLRNSADTAPYMHDGQLATLDDVVRHYSELNLDRLHADGQQILRPLKLSDAERADLVAFLRTLSDPLATSWQPVANASACRTPRPVR